VADASNEKHKLSGSSYQQQKLGRLVWAESLCGYLLTAEYHSYQEILCPGRILITAVKQDPQANDHLTVTSSLRRIAMKYLTNRSCDH